MVILYINSNIALFQHESTRMRLAKSVRECPEAHNPGAIVLAASQVMRKDGFNDAAKVITALQDDPEIGTKLKKAIKLDLDTPRPKAHHVRTLSLVFRRDVSVREYEDWRKEINATAGYALYPSYQVLARSKDFLHPKVRLNKFLNMI